MRIKRPLKQFNRRRHMAPIAPRRYGDNRNFSKQDVMPNIPNPPLLNPLAQMSMQVS